MHHFFRRNFFESRSKKKKSREKKTLEGTKNNARTPKLEGTSTKSKEEQKKLINDD